jgi:glycosyltransferase involved in cell wall biosynthesis
MRETSLSDEYQKLLPDVAIIFVIPKIPFANRNTSYLYQLYKHFLNEPSKIKIVTFNAISLPGLALSRLKSEKSILHYHWFEFENLKSFIGIKWKLFWIILYKILGGKIVWTVHNRYPHPNKYLFLNKKIRKYFAGLADKLHVHCVSSIEIATGILGVKKNKFFVVKHPVLPAEIFGKDKAIGMLNKKYCSNQLKVDDNIFLMFGAIAEYKGIKEVIDIFKTLGEKNKLIVAGFIKRGNQDYFNELKTISDNRRIFLAGKIIPDEEVPYFLNSADYAIFNYRDILTSGGVHLALSYKKAVVVPSAGCLKELSGNYIYFFEPDEKRQENLKNLIKKLSL